MSGSKSIKYNSLGFDKDGYDKDGFDARGYDEEGYDRAGYNIEGVSRAGYKKHDYNEKEYNDRGWNKVGRNRIKFYVGDWECCGNPGLAKDNPNPYRHHVKGKDRSALGDLLCNIHNHAPCYPDLGGCVKLDDGGKKRPKEETPYSHSSDIKGPYHSEEGLQVLAEIGASTGPRSSQGRGESSGGRGGSSRGRGESSRGRGGSSRGRV